MPKKILYESAVHQFMWAGSRLRTRLSSRSPQRAEKLAAWFRSLHLDHPGPGALRLAWSEPTAGETTVYFKGARFYTRGDTPVHVEQQAAHGLLADADKLMEDNMAFFDELLRRTIVEVGLLENALPAAVSPAASSTMPEGRNDLARKAAEETFHDDWAASEDVESIDVRKRNEACSAPEMRHVRRVLGDLRGKSLLDVGCGLGEACVYFALEGATVTATDVSPGMCDITRRLALANSVELETHVSAAEDLHLGNRQFDVIHTANTLHHVNIAETMDRLLPHLRPNGCFVSWDPVGYNPLINVYRRIATEVRTPDEHPLRLRDVRLISSRFETCEVRWFWFTTLAVFLWMVLVQRRNPNQVRLWKKVIDDADRISWLYRPLERIDRFVLALLPFLRPLCWNVVVIGRHPRRQTPAA